MKNEFPNLLQRVFVWTIDVLFGLWHHLLIYECIPLTSIIGKHHTLKPVNILFALSSQINLTFIQSLPHFLIHLIHTIVCNLQTLSDCCPTLYISTISIHSLHVFCHFMYNKLLLSIAFKSFSFKVPKYRGVFERHNGGK